MMEQSESMTNFAAAMVVAQGEMLPLIKNAENPFYNSKYADMKTCYNACRGALDNAGILVMHVPGCNEHGNAVVYCTFFHVKSGEWMRGSFPLKSTKEGPQATGSALTYGRRYLLCAMAGLTPEEDDGNMATLPIGEDTGDSRPPTEEQIETMRCELTAADGDEKIFLEYLGCESWKSMTAAQYKKGVAGVKIKQDIQKVKQNAGH